MRALVLGLILVNVLYWTWSGNVDTRDIAPVRALDPDLPSLTLVSRAPDTELDVSALEPLLVPRTGADDVLSIDEQDEDTAATEPVNVSLGIEESVSPDPAVPPSQQTVPAQGAGEATASAADATPDVSTAELPAPTPAEPVIEQNLLATVDPVSNPARCVAVGPFASLRQASDAAALLNQAGLTTSQRVEEAQVWVGHWVHLPAYPTRVAAIEVVERLREEGVKDIYIEPSGELKNTISLGLFTELERAEIRAGNVRKLGGVSPQIRNRSRDGLVYWIDLSLEAGIELDTTGLPHNTSQELRIESVNCPSASANG